MLLKQLCLMPGSHRAQVTGKRCSSNTPEPRFPIKRFSTSNEPMEKNRTVAKIPWRYEVQESNQVTSKLLGMERYFFGRFFTKAWSNKGWALMALMIFFFSHSFVLSSNSLVRFVTISSHGSAKNFVPLSFFNGSQHFITSSPKGGCIFDKSYSASQRHSSHFSCRAGSKFSPQVCRNMRENQKLKLHGAIWWLFNTLSIPGEGIYDHHKPEYNQKAPIRCLSLVLMCYLRLHQETSNLWTAILGFVNTATTRKPLLSQLDAKVIFFSRLGFFLWIKNFTESVRTRHHRICHKANPNTQLTICQSKSDWL